MHTAHTVVELSITYGSLCLQVSTKPAQPFLLTDIASLPLELGFTMCGYYPKQSEFIIIIFLIITIICLIVLMFRSISIVIFFTFKHQLILHQPGR